MEQSPLPQICPHCQNLVPDGSVFCPRCGKGLKETEKVPGAMRQIVIYAVSFFLPPVGLFWSVKYFRTVDPRAKKVAIISLVLTIVAIILNIYLLTSIFGALTSSLSGLSGLNFNY